MKYKKAKSFFHFALGILIVLSVAGFGFPAQAQNFSFSYTGPDTLFVDGSCTAILDWGHPATPTAYANSPGATIVKFEIYSISGGYEIGDPVPAGPSCRIVLGSGVRSMNRSRFFSPPESNNARVSVTEYTSQPGGSHETRQCEQ